MKRQQTGNSVKNFVQQIAKIQTFYRNIQARSTAYIKFYYKSESCVFVRGGFNSTHIQQFCIRLPVQVQFFPTNAAYNEFFFCLNIIYINKSKDFHIRSFWSKVFFFSLSLLPSI